MFTSLSKQCIEHHNTRILMYFNPCVAECVHHICYADTSNAGYSNMA